MDHDRVMRIIDFTLAVVHSNEWKTPLTEETYLVMRNFRTEVTFGTLQREIKEDRSLPPALSRPSDPSTVQILVAFRALKRLREGYSSLDTELAAAEHYMFMRYLARSTGDRLTVALPAGYDVKKRVFGARGKEQAMRVKDDNPTHPPDINVLKWGTHGATEGLKDFKRTRPEDRGLLGSSLLRNESHILRGLAPWQRRILEAMLRKLRQSHGKSAT